jgi:hypothetical protein
MGYQISNVFDDMNFEMFLNELAAEVQVTELGVSIVKFTSKEKQKLTYQQFSLTHSQVFSLLKTLFK